jgi:hypothetical protein
VICEGCRYPSLCHLFGCRRAADPVQLTEEMLVVSDTPRPVAPGLSPSILETIREALPPTPPAPAAGREVRILSVRNGFIVSSPTGPLAVAMDAGTLGALVAEWAAERT